MLEAAEATSSEATPGPETQTVPTQGKLRSLAVRGSFFEILSYGISQALRLGGNLLLTRLLFPEAFGQAALVTIFVQGLVMLSDVGISPGVVQSHRGDEVRFLNTAWTMRVIRGAALYLVALLLAWPVAWIYDDALLGPLLAMGSAVVLIEGFESTSVMTLLRRVDARRKMIVDLASQVTGLGATVIAVLLTQSVWGLISGSLVASVVRVVISHRIDVGYKNRFEWSKDSALAIVQFGRWILFSSAVSFAGGQLDRIFLGKFLGFGELGVYTVAVALADVGAAVGVRLTQQVLFPVFSRVHREQGERLKELYYKSRFAMDALILPAAGALFVLAPWVIEFLYDDRYEAAGWMLRVLTVRVAFTCIVGPCETCLFAMGNSHYTFVKSLSRAVWMVVGLPVGYHFYGIVGLIWVTALSELPALLLLLGAFWQRGLLSLRRELLVPVFFGLGAAAAYLVTLSFGG